MSTSTSTPIVNIDDIPEKKQYSYNDPFNSIIPDKFRDRIISLIDDMETELEQNCYISVRIQGKNSYRNISS